MLNELQEFLAYTQVPAYTAISKRDTSYLGRFTFQVNIPAFESMLSGR